MKVIRTKTSELHVDEHGIFHKKVIENCHVDLENLKESDKLTEELTNGEKVLMVYDARAHFTVTEEAMEYTRKDIFNKKRLATAIISEKTAIKIMVDYLNKTMKLEIPVKVFSNEEDAINWLLGLKSLSPDNDKPAAHNLTRFSKR